MVLISLVPALTPLYLYVSTKFVIIIIIIIIIIIENLNDLYCSPNIVRVIKSRRMRYAGHVAHTGERRGVYSVLVGKPKGKRPLGRPRHRLEDNIKMDLQGSGMWGYGLDLAGSG